jgi:hypothetical protein
MPEIKDRPDKYAKKHQLDCSKKGKDDILLDSDELMKDFARPPSKLTKKEGENEEKDAHEQGFHVDEKSPEKANEGSKKGKDDILLDSDELMKDFARPPSKLTKKKGKSAKKNKLRAGTLGKIVKRISTAHSEKKSNKGTNHSTFNESIITKSSGQGCSHCDRHCAKCRMHDNVTQAMRKVSK